MTAYNGLDFKKAIDIGAEILGVFGDNKLTYHDGTDALLVLMSIALREGHYDDHKAKPLIANMLLATGLVLPGTCYECGEEFHIRKCHCECEYADFSEDGCDGDCESRSSEIEMYDLNKQLGDAYRNLE